MINFTLHPLVALPKPLASYRSSLKLPHPIPPQLFLGLPRLFSDLTNFRVHMSAGIGEELSSDDDSSSKMLENLPNTISPRVVRILYCLYRFFQSDRVQSLEALTPHAARQICIHTFQRPQL